MLTLKDVKSYAQSVTFAKEEKSFLRHEGRHFQKHILEKVILLFFALEEITRQLERLLLYKAMFAMY